MRGMQSHVQMLMHRLCFTWHCMQAFICCTCTVTARLQKREALMALTISLWNTILQAKMQHLTWISVAPYPLSMPVLPAKTRKFQHLLSASTLPAKTCKVQHLLSTPALPAKTCKVQHLLSTTQHHQPRHSKFNICSWPQQHQRRHAKFNICSRPQHYQRRHAKFNTCPRPQHHQPRHAKFHVKSWHCNHYQKLNTSKADTELFLTDPENSSVVNTADDVTKSKNSKINLVQHIKVKHTHMWVTPKWTLDENSSWLLLLGIVRVRAHMLASGYLVSESINTMVGFKLNLIVDTR